MARSCLFCGADADSHEHAFPEWLQRSFNPEGSKAPAELGGRLLTVSGWSFSRVRKVCKACNTGWLNDDFEAPAAELIRLLCQSESRITLEKDHQRLLAGWAYKTTLMLEAASPGSSRLHPSAGKRFRRDRVPPSNTSIVMGISIDPILAFHTIPAYTTDKLGATAHQGYVSLLVAQHVFFHIVGDVGAFNPHSHLTPGSLGREFHQIWPLPGRPLSYPFEVAFTRDAIKDLATLGFGGFELL